MTNGTSRGWGVSVTPRPLFTPGKDPVPIVQEAGWAPGTVRTGAENLAPTRIRSTDRPARSQSLYRLSYRGPSLCNKSLKHKHVAVLLCWQYNSLTVLTVQQSYCVDSTTASLCWQYNSLTVLTVQQSYCVDSTTVLLCWQYYSLTVLTVLQSYCVDSTTVLLCWQYNSLTVLTVQQSYCVDSTTVLNIYMLLFVESPYRGARQRCGKCSLQHIYRVIQNDCRGFNNLSYSIHFR